MHVPAHSIEELIQASPHQALFETLDHWIHLTFPALDRRLSQSGTMTFIGYGELATAKEGDVYDSLIALAPQKHYLACYFAGEKAGAPMLRSYQAHFAASTVGKVCLRLKNSHTIDFAILEAISKDRIAWNESKKTNAGKRACSLQKQL